jgi:toxin ParE1/3/4
MARALRYHPLFDCDVREAAGWYDRRASGLGDTFVDLVSQAVAEIIADPERFAPAQTECRYIRVSRFPYVILFDVTDVEILLLGVLHTARSMDKWRERQRDA